MILSLAFIYIYCIYKGECKDIQFIFTGKQDKITTKNIWCYVCHSNFDGALYF